MKAILAVVVYLMMGVVLGLGIYLAVKGSFWLLLASGLAYLAAFARLGCLPR